MSVPSNEISASQKLQCIERELRIRRRNYHRYLATGRISLGKASYELTCMEAIAADYRATVAQERLI